MTTSLDLKINQSVGEVNVEVDNTKEDIKASSQNC